ncbi:carbohydrate kinase [Iocasia frigidifontis]|uniref:Carbohydrate kinase n=1 Tax=Iocasia fonsfrigidae TaxID=2682810 RepID=A0A8A7KGI5_9FIRM|nr:PfkB family carbohydrate kinase [Iocasia fonsfrigidae]QTL96992.1 carbohydrate kinase [Iocasia fonsfrigidae]
MIEAIDSFKNKKIMVIGDIIADEFIIGEPERLSREAPVIILRHRERDILPGGGANAASNIASLGGMVSLAGVIGRDRTGEDLLCVLQGQGMDINGLITSPDRPTAVKTRIIAGGNQVVKQQVARIDHFDETLISKEIENSLLDFISGEIVKYDGILISDYGLGLFTDRLKQGIVELAGSYDKFTVVDSRYDLLDYQGVSLATPNLEEAGQALDRCLLNQNEVVEAGLELINRMQSTYLLITQGGDGMTVFTAEGDYKHIPVANYAEVFDVTGAGDTVVGTILLALCTGLDIYQAMELANCAAGIVVRKAGVATVNPAELKEELKKQ